MTSFKVGDYVTWKSPDDWKFDQEEYDDYIGGWPPTPPFLVVSVNGLGDVKLAEMKSKKVIAMDIETDQLKLDPFLSAFGRT